MAAKKLEELGSVNILDDETIRFDIDNKYLNLLKATPPRIYLTSGERYHTLEIKVHNSTYTLFLVKSPTNCGLCTLENLPFKYMSRRISVEAVVEVTLIILAFIFIAEQTSFVLMHTGIPAHREDDEGIDDDTFIKTHSDEYFVTKKKHYWSGRRQIYGYFDARNAYETIFGKIS